MGHVFFSGGHVGKKSRLPKGYTELEYIQSSGKQYIDTGYYVAKTTRIVCDFQYTAKPSATTCLFRIASPAYGFGWQSTGVFRSWGGSTYSFPTTFSATDRHVVDKRGTVCILDGTEAATTAHSANTSYTLPLFGYNNAGTMSQLASLKLFSCQIYEGDTLVRDFVPCLSEADGVGLFDLVNNQFYGNAGSGSFVGSEVA